MGCLFCEIASGERPSEIVYKQEGVTAFRDIAPEAPTHILIVPDLHLEGAAFVGREHEELVGRLVRVAAELAQREGISERGYRLVINQGADAGQTIDHLHLHLIGGRGLSRPLA